MTPDIIVKVFPVINIGLSLLAAAVYAFHLKWWDAAYWICAGALVFVVTFRK